MPAIRIDIPSEHTLARRGGRPLGLRTPVKGPRFWSAIRKYKLREIDPGHGTIWPMLMAPALYEAVGLPPDVVGHLPYQEALGLHARNLQAKPLGVFAPGRLRARSNSMAKQVLVRAGDTLLVEPELLQTVAQVLAGNGWTVTGRLSMPAQPTIHLASFGWRSHYGPGATLSAMGETPAARLASCDGVLEPGVVDAQAVAELRAGRLLLEVLLERYAARLAGAQLGPGALWYRSSAKTPPVVVSSGATVCCSCPPSSPSCHLRRLAIELQAQGWVTFLHGERQTVPAVAA